MRAEQKRRFDWMNLMAAHGELLTRDHEDLALMKVESDELWEKQMAVTKRILHADWVNKKLTLRAIDETARRTGKGIPEGLEKMFVAKNQESATTGKNWWTIRLASPFVCSGKIWLKCLL